MKKFKFLFAYVMLFGALATGLTSCDDCDGISSEPIEFSAEKQFVSLTYLVDSSGANYAQTLYNPNNVRVMLNKTGGRGQYERISEDLADGMIGPFAYTVSPDLIKKGVYYEYRYIITKDTFGIDTLDVAFYPRVDECEEYWSFTEFKLNGVVLPGSGEGNTICAHEVRE